MHNGSQPLVWALHIALLSLLNVQVYASRCSKGSVGSGFGGDSATSQETALRADEYESVGLVTSERSAKCGQHLNKAMSPGVLV